MYKVKDGYEERVKQQLEGWLNGNPQHNVIDDECCPDFSCCRPELLQPEEVRKSFAAARPGQQVDFFAVFLSAACSASGRNVHIISDKPDTNSN